MRISAKLCAPVRGGFEFALALGCEGVGEAWVYFITSFDNNFFLVNFVTSNINEERESSVNFLEISCYEVFRRKKKSALLITTAPGSVMHSLLTFSVRRVRQLCLDQRLCVR